VNVLLLGPGYPAEIPYFARGLAAVGAHVFGVGEQAESQLPDLTKRSLSGYLQVQSFSDEAAVMEAVQRWVGTTSFHRVEALWEPLVLLAARLREVLGAPGMRYEQVLCFRDKDRMKQAVAAAGLRVARHLRGRSPKEFREAAEQIGFPLCIKPVAGAGSADTYRVESMSELDSIIRKLSHVGECNVEEFIEGEEFTFDTISIDGEIQYFNIAWYRPPPLIGRSLEWTSPQTITLRDVDGPEFASGRELGRKVTQALGYETGFTHMEWFRKADGEAVFGEIAARPPGAHSVDIMNFGSDIDTFTGWAEAVVHRKLTMNFERLYNCAIIFKRAQGQGRIQRVEGLDRVLASFGEHVVLIDLLPIGAHRRNWVQTLLSDGFIVLRHPDLTTTLEMADRVGTDVQIHAA
jgi:formate-dependent phosphoribosylglycinamide formyltransferase (GAR transformylase)